MHGIIPYMLDYCAKPVVHLFVPKSSMASVTRLGENSPIWQNFKNLWQNVDFSFPIWQNAEPILAIL